jgi:hypothetical protein
MKSAAVADKSNVQIGNVSFRVEAATVGGRYPSRSLPDERRWPFLGPSSCAIRKESAARRLIFTKASVLATLRS